MAFAAAGITQTYLERILGIGYLETQLKIQVHFLMLVATGALFVAGVALFLWDFFFLAGRPVAAAGTRAARARRARPADPSPMTLRDGGPRSRAVGGDGRRPAASGRGALLPAGRATRSPSSRPATRGGCPVMLKGPTGCGKTRFVEHMAWRLRRPLVTVACHDDLSASDLVGRYLVRASETVWQDGPLTRAVRAGAICYLDEIVEARQDTIVVIHPLTDDRRVLPIDKTGELRGRAAAASSSSSPTTPATSTSSRTSSRARGSASSRSSSRSRRPSSRSRIVVHEGGVDRRQRGRAGGARRPAPQLRDRGLPEVPSTRLLVAAARLIASGVSPREACRAAVAAPLTDDPELLAAVHDVIDAAAVARRMGSPRAC